MKHIAIDTFTFHLLVSTRALFLVSGFYKVIFCELYNPGVTTFDQTRKRICKGVHKLTQISLTIKKKYKYVIDFFAKDGINRDQRRNQKHKNLFPLSHYGYKSMHVVIFRPKENGMCSSHCFVFVKFLPQNFQYKIRNFFFVRLKHWIKAILSAWAN